MTKLRLFILATLLLSLSCSAQPKPPETEKSKPKPAFKLLPSEEDWSGSKRPLKDMAFDRTGRVRLSLGGSIRFQHESYKNQIFDGTSRTFDDSYLLNRATLHGDLHLGKSTRLFADIHSALPIDLQLPPSPIDRDELFLHQAFLEQRFRNLALRVGRQELHFGSGRLISVREGPNIRLSFDAARLELNLDNWELTAFWGRPTQTRLGEFNNPWLSDERWLSGLYSRSSHQEYYLLILNDARASFGERTGREQRATLGGRWFGESGPWDYNFEAFYQFGSFEGQTIRAWSVASDTGYRFENLPGRPRLGLKANIISGDTDPADTTLNTFNALFPNGSYFGEIALIGPSNLINLHPNTSFQLTQKLELEARVDFFWRYSLLDGVYTPPGFLLREAGPSRASFIGTQPDLTLTYKPGEQWNMSLDYSLFIPGDFMKQQAVNDTIHFTQASLKYRF